MSNTIRIRTTPNGSDKYLKVKLEQDWDFIEILSLKISQEDTYRKFCSDYGVIVGRVIINNGFGVPNAKVSVFIPLDAVDKNDPLISGLYPFEVISDKDSEGIRYNLFPKDSSPTNDCYTPIGTFPSKREILDNETLLNVYCKYYKFTTTTNHAGDFMLFGVPLGTYTVHVDADISDIGIASQRPYDLISQGTPSKLFQSTTKFRGDKNLDKLIQVKTMNTGVNVQPFWGDTDNCEIGITRLDFDLNYNLVPAAIFMGGIYGDQDKHSVNKHCRPRIKLGKVNEQVAGPGSVKMIRKTIDNKIEPFDVEGGYVIDNDGTWAYQIPMNLDYMITNEEGSLVFSQDPNKGIPTRARVRFNIGMDETGGEGRLRTRARYLVPNNPSNASEVDYEFSTDTKETSFRDLYWNKIYSVSNFISRFQRDSPLDKILPVKSRFFTGMKDVDEGTDKQPFPYNRVSTSLNPIFFIICLIIKIVAFLIYMMNKFFIPLINVIIDAINTVVGAVVNMINSIISFLNSISNIVGGNSLSDVNFTPIDYVGCVTVKCNDEEPSIYAPGCRNGGTDSGHAFQHANSITPIDYYCGDSVGHDCTFSDYAVGLDNCIAFEMARALDLFKFDFYNDWVNGSLFGFLLKYKKKKKGREVFCEYDCGDFSGGVDGNNNGVSDNSCQNNILLDSCFDGSGHYNLKPPGNNQQAESKETGTIREGLIKKVDDEFFYAATTHDVQYKLYATELINLGSVFECDWQGIPHIQNLLIPTTYKMPPDVLEQNDTHTIIETCGLVDIGGNTSGEFFSISCLGLHVNYKQCLNIRHICEMGVDIDQAVYDSNGAVVSRSDCIIGSNDIDDDNGRFFRDVFYGLNHSSTPWIGQPYLNLPSGGYDTNFNLQNCGEYDFAHAGVSTLCISGPNNGQEYVDFRGIQNDSTYSQPKHSYFFYFGLLPGKTGLDKMNQRYFSTCTSINRDDLLIQATTTTAVGATGTLTFTFIGGTGPYVYSVSGPSGTFTGTANPTQTLSGLSGGTYVITGTDSLGTPVSQTIIIPTPPAFYCSVGVTLNATTTGSADGEITISSLGGGTAPYTASTFDSLGSLVFGPTTVTAPTAISGLLSDTYSVSISDSVGATCVTTGLTVSGAHALLITAATTNISCYGLHDGTINLGITGGQPPLTILTTGLGFSSSSTNMSGLYYGTYITNVVDSNSITATTTNTLTQPTKLAITLASNVEMGNQCDPTQYLIPFKITSGGVVGPVDVMYLIDNTGLWTTVSLPFVSTSSNIYLPITSTITNYIDIKFKNTTSPCESNVIRVYRTAIELPPVVLTVTPDSAFNLVQCNSTSVTFRVSISHIVRAPYTINYTINGGPIQTTTTSTSQTIITTPAVSGVQNISLNVVDSKGCIAYTTFIINTPIVNLAGNIITTYATGNYTHIVTASGGIGTRTGSPFTIGTHTNTSPAISTTITDSVGCTILLIG